MNAYPIILAMAPNLPGLVLVGDTREELLENRDRTRKGSGLEQVEPQAPLAPGANWRSLWVSALPAFHSTAISRRLKRR